MEDAAELQVKLDRAQAHVERGAGHILRQKALIARGHDQGGRLLRSLELLATL
jgi:hypothetical protein